MPARRGWFETDWTCTLRPFRRGGHLRRRPSPWRRGAHRPGRSRRCLRGQSTVARLGGAERGGEGRATVAGRRLDALRGPGRARAATGAARMVTSVTSRPRAGVGRLGVQNGSTALLALRREVGKGRWRTRRRVRRSSSAARPSSARPCCCLRRTRRRPRACAPRRSGVHLQARPRTPPPPPPPWQPQGGPRGSWRQGRATAPLQRPAS